MDFRRKNVFLIYMASHSMAKHRLNRKDYNFIPIVLKQKLDIKTHAEESESTKIKIIQWG